MRVAAYARYSSDSQREASLEDQLRNCRAYALRQGWPAPEVFTDAAISGARLDRPGYAAVLAGRFDVILVDDLSRLSRDAVECQRAVRRLTFAGVRLVGVSDGVDTGRKSHKADVGLRGLMSELYLDDLADKTHRGLTGRALAGASAGGLPYGYRVTETGQRAILEDEAAIVRRIFGEYAAGLTPRAIAAALNREGIPSPRGGSWTLTAIRADVRRGIGILGNPIYIGRQVWNRSRWVKHPETGRRVRQERPESEWIVREAPGLAIVERSLWDAVEARVRGGKHASPVGKGRPPKHVLSGILRCGECGGPMTVIDRYRYGCGRAKDRGTCSSTLRFSRLDAERAVLAGVRAELGTPQAYAAFQRAVAEKMRRHAPNVDALKRRLAEAERERGNVLVAIRAGIITPSTKAELERLEREAIDAQRAVAAGEQQQPAKILPRAREVWTRMLERLADVRDKPAAREALRTLVGERIVVRLNENGDPIAEVAASCCQISLVAGAGSVPYLAGPLLIPLSGRG
jgi:DNA invertase Pin-like site-specific DNA recombinase